MRQFSVGSRTFRFAAHHTGTDAELDRFVQDVERVVREEGAIYGEYPEYEPGTYTFLADYLPYADGDGMEHRNSTVMTSSASIRRRSRAAARHGRARVLSLLERRADSPARSRAVRSRSREHVRRAVAGRGLHAVLRAARAAARRAWSNLDETGHTFADLVDAVVNGPGRAVRSAEDMSRMAPFIDGGRPIDRTNWSNTVISYYPFGGAIALALDLTLRDRSDGKTTLDDYMRAMWRVHGKPGGAREGLRGSPVHDGRCGSASGGSQRRSRRSPGISSIGTSAGARWPTTAVSCSAPDSCVRKRDAGRAWWGDVRIEARSDGARIGAVVPANAPAYAAGIDQDDTLLQIAGERVTSAEAVNTVLSRHRPGERVTIVYVDRTGASKTASVVLAENPHVDVVAIEAAGGSLTPAQRAFRDRWLKSQQ